MATFLRLFQVSSKSKNRKCGVIPWSNIERYDRRGFEIICASPGVQTKEEAIEFLKEEFSEVLSDVNVSCLEVACFHAAKDATSGLIPNLTKERFMGRPGLVADELLGMTNADYIAGARGIFEFIRFDQAKPGILKKLRPITNDAIGGLIAGVSSNMYTRAISEDSRQRKG